MNVQNAMKLDQVHYLSARERIVKTVIRQGFKEN